MTARHTASAPATLTDRQREVLALLAQGLTNYEIAQALDISLEGAKYHVREVMGKLNVETREEAAAWYRRQRRPSARIAALARGLVPIAWWKAAAGVTAGVAVAGIGALAVVALNNNGDENPPVSAETATPPGEPALCGPGDAVFELFEADPMDDITLLVVTGRAAAPCTLRGAIDLTLSADSPSDGPSEWSTSIEVDIVLDVVRANLLHANWTGYCFPDAFVQLHGATVDANGRLIRELPTLDVINQPGCAQPESFTAVFALPLSFRPDLGPVEEIVCPITPGYQAQCEVVDELFAALVSNTPSDLLRRLVPSVFTCEGPGSDRWLPLCEDVPPGEPATGVAVRYLDGSLGAITLLDLTRYIESLAATPGGGMTVACLDQSCSEFVLGLGLRGELPAIGFSFTTTGRTGPVMTTVTLMPPGREALALRRGGSATVATLAEKGSTVPFELTELTFTRIIPSY